ncbi:WD40 repeat domain-containing protein [Yinghuangia sp. ASG 101]|uniref:WD40 repeat domain-containing protein n=1 Tax=Yinghuangia sp. ASG 101 TaxID=2896848 RepID=UPI003FCE2B85
MRSPYRRTTGPHGRGEYIHALAFGPAGPALAVGAHDKVVRLWDPHPGTLRSQLAGHTAAVVCLAFSIDGRTLVTGTHIECLLGDTHTGKAVPGHSGAVVPAQRLAPDIQGHGRAAGPRAGRLPRTRSCLPRGPRPALRRHRGRGRLRRRVRPCASARPPRTRRTRPSGDHHTCRARSTVQDSLSRTPGETGPSRSVPRRLILFGHVRGLSPATACTRLATERDNSATSVNARQTRGCSCAKGS